MRVAEREIESEKMETESEMARLRLLVEESDGTVQEVTNQVIELEGRLREMAMENELLRKEVSAVAEDNSRKTKQIKSAQRVALSIIREQSSGSDGRVSNTVGGHTDMFGLQKAPEPDLMTSLLTYLLPFLFEEDDQPKIV